MGNTIGKILGAYTPSVGTPVSSAGTSSVGSYKTSGYASIPYERAPQVVDSVPTKDAAGNPLLAGYVTPNKTWIA